MTDTKLFAPYQPDPDICFGCGKPRVVNRNWQEDGLNPGVLPVSHRSHVQLCANRRSHYKSNCLRLALHKLHDDPVCWWCETTEDRIAGKACRRCTSLIEEGLESDTPRKLYSISEYALDYISTKHGVGSKPFLELLLDCTGTKIERGGWHDAEQIATNSGHYGGGWKYYLSLTLQQRNALAEIIPMLKALLERAQLSGRRHGTDALRELIEGERSAEDFEDYRTKTDRKLAEASRQLRGDR